MEKGKTKRITVTLTEEKISKLQSVEKFGISKSTLLQLLINKYLDAEVENIGRRV